MAFPVFMYGCEKWTIKESLAPKNWCFWTVVLEKTLESPLGCKEIQPVHPKGDQSWVFIGRTDVEAEAPVIWPPHAKSWLAGKHPDAGKDWGQEEKGMTEDEMVGWHHWLDEHEFDQAPGVADGQGSLVCFSPWGCKESYMTELLTELNWMNKKEINKQTKRIYWAVISTVNKINSALGYYIRWSVQFSHSVMSNSLRPHGLQHTRLPHLVMVKFKFLLHSKVNQL